MNQNRTGTEYHGSALSYTIGFILSLVLSIGAYLLVSERLLEGTLLLAGIFGCALTQLIVQLMLFLHLGREARPRWKLFVFLFMLLVVTILVAGSLWIMSNLDYNMMPREMDEYMLKQSQKGF